MKRMLLICLFLLPALALAQVEFEAETVGSFDGGLNANAGDLDGDGDMDVVGAAESSDQFAWWENTGDGWTYHLLGTMNWATDVEIVDMGGDGDLDIIGAAGTDEISWFENDGTGNFTHHIIENFDWSRDVETADMDDDGDIDFIVAHNDGVSWLENVGVNETIWPETLLFEYNRARGMDVKDIDGDGDVDIAIGSADTQTINSVSWFENQDGVFGEHLLDDSHGMAYGVEIADFNGDGAMDVVASARSDYITWWENGSWTEHIVVDPFDGARDIYPGDIDGDGDMDIAAAAADGDEIAWFENADGTGIDWTWHTIDNSRDYAAGVHVADMDDDGDLDVIGVWYYTDEVVLYTQLGTPGPVLFSLDRTFDGVIPEAGGQVVYDVTLTSTLPNSVPGLNYWTMVTIPNGQTVGPLTVVPFTLQPFMDVTVTGLTQSVPAAAPGGSYEFTGYVGYMGNPSLQVSDSFTFTKLGAAAGAAFNPADWPAGGQFLADDGAAEPLARPTEYALGSAYPNPFNPSTRIGVTLPESAELTVRVVNLNGRTVAELANGSFGAGHHAFQFDAAGLAAGLYFVHATVPGHLNAVQKVTLVK